MTKTCFFLLLILSTASFANEDVCCVMGGAQGDSVQTFAKIMSSSECKTGGTFQGKKICASIPDPENTYCGAESSYKDRCGKCGYFWTGKECLTEDPKEKAKKELKAEEEEAKKKEADKKAGITTPSSKPVQPSTPSAKPYDPDNPNVNNAVPEEDSLYNRKSKGITDDNN